MSKTNKETLYKRFGNHFGNLAITQRITLVYGGIFSFSLLILSVFFFLNLTILEQNNIHKQLEKTVYNIEQFLQNGESLTDETLRNLLDHKYVEVSVYSVSEQKNFTSYVGEVPEFLKEIPAHMEEKNKRDMDVPVQNGHYRIHSLKDLGGSTQEFLLESAKKQRVLLISERFQVGDYTYQIQAFKQLNGNQYLMHAFLTKMLIANILCVFCAFLAGRYVSHKILKPVERIRRTAEQISIEDLSKRIPIEGPDDEMKELSLTFNSMIDRLEDAFQRQNQFVSDASHELRTPISVIQGYASLINRWGKSDPEVLQESIDSILSETDHMKELIHNLLFLAKSDQNRIHAKKERMCLNDVAQDIVKDLALIAENRDVQYEGKEIVEVCGDNDLLKQLLWIHGENALKYTVDGGKITIRVWKDQKYAYASVEDDGIGIAEEEQSKIFNRFYREDKSRNKEISGTGLGLSIAKWIADSHDATILVESKRGEGTKFIDRFPLYIQPKEEQTKAKL